MTRVRISRSASVLGLIAGLLLSGGAWFVITGAKQHFASLQETTARVLARTIKRRIMGPPRSTGVVERLSQSLRKQVFRPVITYSYEVKGRPYLGQQYDARATEGSARWARGVVRRFPVGHDVPVFYNPRNPDEAMLVRGWPGPVWWWLYGALWAGLAVGLASGWVFMLQRPKRRHARSETAA